jgi:predicted nucleotidyltransferase
VICRMSFRKRLFRGRGMIAFEAGGHWSRVMCHCLRGKLNISQLWIFCWFRFKILPSEQSGIKIINGAESLDRADAIKLAQKFTAEVQAKFDCKQTFLFGSYAKGTPHEESDIDIAVILKDYENKLDMQLELMRIRRKIDSRIEPHPFREEEFNNSNPMAYEILKYGQRIDVNI